jgi:hypothetical protein
MAFSVEPSPEVWHRGDIPLLCNWRRLWRCAEVGVDRGEFAAMFLDRFPQCSDYWAIDPYLPYPEMPYDRQADYLMAVTRLERHARRAKLVKMASVEAARLFLPDSLDFVYIDGAHDHASVAADLRAWWPVLSEQGILAGHDFDDQPAHAGVKQAVTEFAEAHDLTVYLTSVEPYLQEECPSWYCYRSVMPGAQWRRC